MLKLATFFDKCNHELEMDLFNKYCNTERIRMLKKDNKSKT